MRIDAACCLADGRPWGLSKLEAAAADPDAVREVAALAGGRGHVNVLKEIACRFGGARALRPGPAPLKLQESSAAAAAAAAAAMSSSNHMRATHDRESAAANGDGQMLATWHALLRAALAAALQRRQTVASWFLVRRLGAPTPESGTAGFAAATSMLASGDQLLAAIRRAAARAAEMQTAGGDGAGAGAVGPSGESVVVQVDDDGDGAAAHTTTSDGGTEELSLGDHFAASRAGNQGPSGVISFFSSLPGGKHQRQATRKEQRKRE
jgi:hypothetical protein